MKNSIFDIGNVLLSFQPEKFLLKYYDYSTMGDLLTIIFASDEWIQLDLGNMMIDDVKKALTLKHSHYYNEINFVLDHWTEMLSPIQKNVDIVYKLKEQGYSLYLLSNFHKEAIGDMFNKYDFFQEFDGYVISAFEHVIKPEPNIYKILLNKYNLNPKECLFIDDMWGNVCAGEQLGIQGLHLAYGIDLQESLKTIGIL